MGIKVQNLNLKFKIADYKNNANKLARFDDNGNIIFVDSNNLQQFVFKDGTRTGMELRTYCYWNETRSWWSTDDSKLVITKGYFYDDVTDSIIENTEDVIIEKAPLDTIYGYGDFTHKIYYNFVTKQFVDLTTEPTDRCKFLGLYTVYTDSATQHSAGGIAPAVMLNYYGYDNTNIDFNEWCITNNHESDSVNEYIDFNYKTPHITYDHNHMKTTTLYSW